MVIFWSPEYVASSLNFATTRKSAVVADLCSGHDIQAPWIQLYGQDLAECHNPAYIDAVSKGTPQPLAESNGFGWDPLMYTTAVAHCSGVVSALAYCLEYKKNCVTLSSGLHHARRNHGALFCTFNGIALAVNRASLSNVLILDFDAHGGGGTASLLTKPYWQFDLCTQDLDLQPLSRLVTHMSQYIPHVKGILLEAGTMGWDAVLYNAGVDIVDTPEDLDILREREQLVYSWAREHNIPVAATLAGGYGDLDEVAKLHMITINAASEFSK